MLLFNQIAAVIGTLLGGIEDLRTFEVPDWINFSMMFVGVGASLIFSVFRDDFTILISSVAGLSACFLLGCLMFYTRQWGGGDAKMLMGLGALIGLDVTNLTGVPLLLLVLVNTFIFGALWGLIWSGALAVRRWDDFKEEFRENLYGDKITLIRKANLAVSVVLLIGIIFVPLAFKVMLFAVLVFLYLSIYMWIFAKSVEKCCMVFEREVEDLVEGDWVVNAVEVEGETIVDPDDLGIKKSQIEDLKDGGVEKVIVREGVPFTISFFVGTVVTFLLGNWFVYLV